MRIDCSVYLEVDQIDHLTIRCRKGEPLKRKTAIKMIKRYTACFESVAKAFEGADVTYEALNKRSDEDLYADLIKIRTALINEVL
ncbi:MAG: hypothetical protein IJS90_08065 [Clostridia bacterium]|nr:hypothetical protein [Clostridia bacterium]